MKNTILLLFKGEGHILLVTTINTCYFIFMQHYGIHSSNENLQLEFNQRGFYQVPSEVRRNLGASAYR